MGALFIAQYSALSAILDESGNTVIFIFIPVISRALSALAVLCLKPMPQSGYAKMFNEKSKPVYKAAVLVILALCALFFVLLCALCGLIIFLTMAAAFILAVFFTYREFSGISGDLTGFALVISELAGLLAFALL
jgi:adenosylcobinamide-GDP ribazoletransferase